MTRLINIVILSLMIILKLTNNSQAQDKLTDKVKFINFYYENASQVIWEAHGDTAIKINFLYDYERGSLNRQSTHINLRIDAEKGTELNLILSGFIDIYNGRKKTSYGRSSPYNISFYFSEDYKTWEGVETTRVPDSNFDLQVKYTMKSNSVYIAKLPVYSLSHLEDFKNSISSNDLVKIIPIGHTVEMRPLEIIRVGDPEAKHSILVRARSHGWETAGNWVIEGIVRGFIEESQQSSEWSNLFCYYIMPMANKDCVYHGMTRFNVSGSDLNRAWGLEADSLYAPENYFLEQFLQTLIKEGKQPEFAIDFHNDNWGNLQVAKSKQGDEKYHANMEIFHRLMSEKTWFSGKLQKVHSDDPKMFHISAGLYERFDIHACILEFNGDWIEKLNKMPSSTDWQHFGKGLNEVFSEYFKHTSR